MMDGNPAAAAAAAAETPSCEEGAAEGCGVDVRAVKFVHGGDSDDDDEEDDGDDDQDRDVPAQENGEVPGADSANAAEVAEEADQVPELPATDVEIEELSPPLTPDGGWGWMVVAATFVTNLIVDGVAYTFGIIMPELLDYFDAGKGKTALVGSMIPGVYLIVGNRRFSSRFSVRQLLTIRLT